MAGKNSVFVNNSAPSVDDAYLNLYKTENNNIITGSAQSLSDAISNQMAIGVSRFSANNFYIDSGSADAYVLTLAASMTNPVSATVDYFIGMTIRFRAGNANTGASTVNVNSAGVKNLKKEDGSTDLVAGDIPTTQDSIFRYDGTSFVLQTGTASTTAKGIVELATDAEAQAFTDTEKAIVPSSLSSAIGQIAVFEDQKASGTNGGTFTSGDWQTRTLNTSVINNITGVSLATNQITLPAGTYQVSGYAVAHDVNQNQTRIQDTTGAATLITGLTTNTTAAGDEGTLSPFQGVFTLSVESDIEVQHRCFSTQATNGFGDAAGFGTNELYCSIMINKIA